MTVESVVKRDKAHVPFNRAVRRVNRMSVVPLGAPADGRRCVLPEASKFLTAALTRAGERQLSQSAAVDAHHLAHLDEQHHDAVTDVAADKDAWAAKTDVALGKGGNRLATSIRTWRPCAIRGARSGSHICWRCWPTSTREKSQRL